MTRTESHDLCIEIEWEYGILWKRQYLHPCSRCLFLQSACGPMVRKRLGRLSVCWRAVLAPRSLAWMRYALPFLPRVLHISKAFCKRDNVAEMPSRRGHTRQIVPRLESYDAIQFLQA